MTCAEQKCLRLTLAASFAVMLMVASSAASAQQRLPTCSGSHWHNCFGQYKFPNGASYEGEYRNGKRSGQGTYIFPDGDKYVGAFKDNELDGQGVYNFVNGNKYLGEHSSGRRQGQGTLIYTNGDTYIGEFRNNDFNGQGTFNYASGGKYVGQYKDSKRHGQGTYTYPNGDKYTGEHREGKLNGQGTLAYTNGDTYVGDFKDNELVGHATYTYAVGGKYVGQYKDNKRNGQGSFTYANGAKYLGEFKDGAQHGLGVEYAPDGTVRNVGLWQNGRFEHTTAVNSVNANPTPQIVATPQIQPLPTVVPPKTLAAIPDQGRRVALLIGNTRYQNSPQLPNAENDADLMAETLRNVGFQSVTVKKDLTQPQMLQALREFSALAENADWALVHYSGHGIEFGGVNYIVPVEARLRSDRDIDLEAVDVGKILSALEGAKRLRLVILDACRDNPLASQMKRTLASRSLGRGLARVEPETGTLIAYAAVAGHLNSE